MNAAFRLPATNPQSEFNEPCDTNRFVAVGVLRLADFAWPLPSGKIGSDAGMAEETEEREDVCVLCSQILAPDDFVVPYGNGLAHWECIEREDHR